MFTYFTSMPLLPPPPTPLFSPSLISLVLTYLSLLLYIGLSLCASILQRSLRHFSPSLPFFLQAGGQTLLKGQGDGISMLFPSDT